MNNIQLGKNAAIKILLFFLLLSVVSACAPKKVRIYAVPDPLRGSVVSSALDLQGRPYKSGAKGPDAFDCSGFVYYVFKQHRMFLPPPAESQGRVGYEVGLECVQPADLVFFRIDNALHVGIVVDTNEFVHASKSRGVTVDSIDTDYWRGHLLGYRSVF
jgi:cell wall-associated NlpC family hydrolase